MFVILTYDVGKKRVSRILKICRRYLVHVQNSVFEGHITEAKLNSLKNEIERQIEKQADSVCIYRFENTKYASKEQIGYVTIHENII